MAGKKQLDLTAQVIESSKERGQKAPKDKEKKKAEDKVSYYRKPEGMDMEQWQIALRRQFVTENDFKIENVGSELVFSDYAVVNPTTKNTYKVALRSKDIGHNFCDCYDFKVSRLGTCKHIEAVFLYVAKKRLKKHLKQPVARTYSSVYVDYLRKRSIRLRIGTESREDFTTLAKNYFDEKGVITASGLARFDVFLQKARALSADFRCYDDALESIIAQREHQRHINKIEAMSDDERELFLKDLVKADMFPYQKAGVLFAYQHGRVILGDEMGLGKTLQAIAAAELLRRERGISRVLILSPTSLKYQWKTEIEKFTGADSLVIEGLAPLRARLHRTDDTFYKIASYHSVLFDWEAIQGGEYDLLILDEAQRIKNWRTKIAQSVRRIQTRHVLVLTGTPIENNLEELYGLAQFVDPFAMGPRHIFFPRYQRTDENGKVIGYDNLGEIRHLLADRLIRRVKKDVLKQLPKRTDKHLIVPMTKPQSDMHRDFADQVAKLVLKWQRMHFLDEQDRQKLLKNLNMMRMVCDSTYIVDQQTNFQTKIDETRNLLEEILEMDGEKVVIFSQWARMTYLVSRELDEMGVDYRYLHGEVPGKNRGALYTDFNAKPEVRVFLSTDAGGVGLNLQAAAWLINLDIPWNPGVLEQRIGRIYRLGQEKPVNIINLVSQGTIEQNLLGVLQFKKSMAAGVLDDGEDSIFLGDSKFKQFMASVEQITRDTASDGIMATIEPDEVEAPAESMSEGGNERMNESVEANQTTEGTEGTELHGGAKQGGQRSSGNQTTEGTELHGGAKQGKQRSSANQTTEDTEDTELHGGAKQGEPTREPAVAARPASGAELIQQGFNFFSQLSATLSDREATTRLVNSIVEKDEKTGQTFVKLPVENTAAVEGALNLLSGLLQAFGQK